MRHPCDANSYLHFHACGYVLLLIFGSSSACENDVKYDVIRDARNDAMCGVNRDEVMSDVKHGFEHDVLHDVKNDAVHDVMYDGVNDDVCDATNDLWQVVLQDCAIFFLQSSTSRSATLLPYS